MLDFLIIVTETEKKFHKRPVEGFKSLHGIKVSTDLIIFTESEFKENSEKPSSLFKKVKESGIKIYEAA